MDLMLIEQLLNKYFEAETTVVEEKVLKAYFSSGNVAPHLQQYSSMFGYFTQQAAHEFNKEVSLKVKKRRYTTWLSIAASIAVLFGVFTFLNKEQPQDDLGTYDNPEVAFKETQKALNMLSKNVNVGVKSVENVGGEFEKSRKTIFK